MRQRLIGAAVLVILAVILIPWLVSNSQHPREQVQTLPMPEIQSAGSPVVLELPALPVSHVAPTVATTGTPVVAEEATSSGKTDSKADHNSVAQQSDETATEAPLRTSNTNEAVTSTTEETADGKRPIQAGDWYLQVASFTSRKNAQQMVDKIDAAGFTAAIEATSIEGKTWYRVQAGPYASELDARAAASRVAAISGTEPIARQASGISG